MSELSCTITRNFSKAEIGLEIHVNDRMLLDLPWVNDQHNITLPVERTNVINLKFVIKNKQSTDHNSWIKISDLRIDNIDLQSYLQRYALYQHSYNNETSDKIVTGVYDMCGCNGVITLDLLEQNGFFLPAIDLHHSDFLPRLDFKHTVNGIDIYYDFIADGGGREFVNDFVNTVSARYGKIPSLLEWCSGAGFIGYSLLAENLCDTLWLQDVYQPAITCCNKTKMYLPDSIKPNVNTWCSDRINQLPADCRFDLVVANPPHNPAVEQKIPSRITHDTEWQIHKNFFTDIPKYLNNNGAIVLVEAYSLGSTPDIFKEMVKSYGLCVTDWWGKDDNYYFIEIKKED